MPNGRPKGLLDAALMDALKGYGTLRYWVWDALKGYWLLDGFAYWTP